MAITEQNKSNVNQSDDSNDYIISFYRDALYLITAGQKYLLECGIDCFNADEEDITGDLTEYTNKYIDCLSSPEWTKYYHIQEEQRVNVRGKKGKHRQRIDIVFILGARKPKLLFKLEAKRLKRPDFTVGKYLGNTGMGEFLSGHYANDSDTAGMLGYVQSDDCEYWADEILNSLKKDSEKVRIAKEGEWRKSRLENIENCYETKHNRPSIQRTLLVYHLLLDFTK